MGNAPTPSVILKKYSGKSKSMGQIQIVSKTAIT
nr:MAG TPA: hypothetical protein [Caudoviricetes sp.]